MDAVIKRLTLKRFRSVPIESIEFDNLTFFVGRNGSGKSNVVDAFAFLGEAMTAPLQAAFDKRGGISTVRNRTSGASYPPNLGLGVEIGAINGKVESARYAFEVKALPNYGFEVIREQCVVSIGYQQHWFDRKRGALRTSDGSPGPALDPSALALPAIGGDARFAPILRTLAAMRVYAIEPAKLREMQDPAAGGNLLQDGSNAASVLQEIERRHPLEAARIAELLGAIVPSTRRVQSKKHGKKLSLEFTQEWGNKKRLKFEAFSMSDGTLRALGLLTAVYQSARPSLVVIEEPEATMHPGALGAILDILKIASSRFQVIVTTHSPELLDSAKWIEDRNLRAVTWTEGATRVNRIPQASRDALKDHLMGAGELLKTNALDVPDLFTDLLANPQTTLFEDLAP